MMRLMKPGTSIRVGQAIVQGASKQYRHREASIDACRAFIGGEISAKFFSYCSGVSFVAVSRRGKYAPRVLFLAVSKPPTRHSPAKSARRARSRPACARRRVQPALQRPLKRATRWKHFPPGARSEFLHHSSTAKDRGLPLFAGVA